MLVSFREKLFYMELSHGSHKRYITHHNFTHDSPSCRTRNTSRSTEDVAQLRERHHANTGVYFKVICALLLFWIQSEDGVMGELSRRSPLRHRVPPAEVQERAVLRSCGQAANADSCINSNKATAAKQHQNTSNATKQQLHSKLAAQQHQQMQLSNTKATSRQPREQNRSGCITAATQDRKNG